MLRRHAAGARTHWSAALAGAGIALAPAAYLTYWGLAWLRHGCGCDEPLYPEWTWAPVLALAAAFYGAAGALLFRALARWRAARAEPRG